MKTFGTRGPVDAAKNYVGRKGKTGGDRAPPLRFNECRLSPIRANSKMVTGEYIQNP